MSIQLPGAYAPDNLDADVWNAIVSVLRRPLKGDEDMIIRKKFAEDIASRYLESDFLASLVFGGIRDVDGRSLQIVAKPKPEAGGGWRVTVSATLLGEP